MNSFTTTVIDDLKKSGIALSKEIDNGEKFLNEKKTKLAEMNILLKYLAKIDD